MLLIYIPRVTQRIRYTFKTVFKTYLNYTGFSITEDLNEFITHTEAKFSYCSKSIGEELNISPAGLLSESGIKEQALSIGEYKGWITLFSNKNKKINYDPFSAIFYMISRYEEYLPHVRDIYDRFTAKESLACQKGFLQTAVVDRWALQLKDLLMDHFPDLHFKKREFRYIPTLDIDNAYAYKHKGIIRTLGSLVKNLIHTDLQVLGNQVKVLIGKKKDPFDTYNYQLNIQKKFGIKPLYFILIGDYGLNDKNLPYENAHFKKLIKSLSDYAYLGIHPSFGSNKNPKKLKVEIKRLENIIKSEVKRSRQHFLKLTLPETYRNLMEQDICEDYTMGFANKLGFRAGTCTPYPFYDLDEEVECNLTVFPFQIMEATLKYYMKLSVDDSIVEIKKIIDEVKAVDGTLISLWHNESLSDEMEWEGWKKVYEEMIAYALKKE